MENALNRILVLTLSIAVAFLWVARHTDTKIASLPLRDSRLRGRLLVVNASELAPPNELRIIVPVEHKRRRLPNLVGYGGEPAASHFPLQLCEGDCDNDNDVSSYRDC